ncbi:hypothetical protein ASPWEDRAFT_176987 [Aspergillus wentii DTO 134E9]|uniref:RING-type domain-containing protein n=1 Tax=Aspergillus wentii DTO 134E9 TaxID=1073089 RepID=A0A1L9R5X9_ASPWE|nr:uncharacterized protein ASPWEDRAFT_176987 [Aspergillus wentii DTO 134E9]KAI9925189.1 hypothetical protein MW887_006109 [Aspergillus wentii]OJJ30322.1 hypothetical protein ASPWEDRAFT_176987 [Aspergillus wentii DTO 134E9]
MDNITPILDFLREQVAEAREQQRGEQPEALSDQDLALQAWQQEIEQYEALRLDRDLAIRLGEGHELHQDQPANSNQPSSHVIPDGVRVQCISCTENFAIANTIRAQCSHNYCGTCAAKLFNSALIDETLFPPRCCRVPIPISTVRHLVGDDFVNRFHEKCLERTDPKSTYCSNSACSKYILSYLVMLNVVTC